MYKVSPLNENQENKFYNYYKEIEKSKKDIRQKIQNKVADFNVFDIDYSGNYSIPEDRMKQIYYNVLSDCYMSYNRYIYEDETIIEDFKNRSSSSEELRYDVPVDYVDIESDLLLIYTKYNDTPLEFKINSFYIPEDDEMQDSPVFSYNDIYNMSNKERISKMNDMSLTLSHTDEDMKKTLNNISGRKQYSSWSLEGFKRNYSEVRKENEAKNYVRNAFGEADSLEEFSDNLVGMLTDFEALRVYCLLSDKMEENAILHPYGILGSELADLLIKEFNLNYCNIPQCGNIILSKKEFSFDKGRFVRKFLNKEELSNSDRKQINRVLEDDEDKIQKFVDYSDEYSYREITKLAEMKSNNRITQKEIDSYSHSLYVSDLTEDGIFEIVKNGRRNKKKKPESLNINKSNIISKKLLPVDLMDQRL
jgi:hypothetical protein